MAASATGILQSLTMPENIFQFRAVHDLSQGHDVSKV